MSFDAHQMDMVLLIGAVVMLVAILLFRLSRSTPDAGREAEEVVAADATDAGTSGR